MKCKICEKEFELKKEEKYLATEKVTAFGTLAKLPKTFEAFDCPHCGCQNIVNIREEEATDYDEDKVVEQLSDRSTLSRPVDWSKVAVDTPILVRDNIFPSGLKDILRNMGMEEFTFGTMDQHRGVAMGVHRGN